MENADALKLLHIVKYDMLSWWTLVVTYNFTMSLDLYKKKWIKIIKQATQFDQNGFLKVEDAGLYTCLASSLAGEDGKNHWITVQGEFQLQRNISPRIKLSLVDLGPYE